MGVGIETAARTLVWAGVTWLALRWFKARDGKVFAYYLMHDYAFSSGLYGETPPVLEARMAAFGEQIVAALQSDVDEVLVVGHSSGAHLAVSILADLLRAGRLPTEAGALSLLTLGQVIPMLSFLPKATKLRADLHDLSCASEITWVDVTAPGDGCAFALCDPVAVSGVAPAEGKRWPLVLSAAFTQTLSPERQPGGGGGGGDADEEDAPALHEHEAAALRASLRRSFSAASPQASLPGEESLEEIVRKAKNAPDFWSGDNPVLVGTAVSIGAAALFGQIPH